MVKNNDNGKRRPTTGDRKLASATRLLEQMVRAGNRVLDEHYDQVVDYCRRVLDDPKVSERDRIRAAQLLTTIVSKSTDVALKQEHGDDEGVQVVVTYDGLPRWSKAKDDD